MDFALKGRIIGRNTQDGPPGPVIVSVFCGSSFGNLWAITLATRLVVINVPRFVLGRVLKPLELRFVRKDRQIPTHKRERSGVAEFHAVCCSARSGRSEMPPNWLVSGGASRDEDSTGRSRTTPTRENFTTGGGIGATTAAVLIAELGDPGRFASAETLTALCSAVSGTPAFRQASTVKFFDRPDSRLEAKRPSLNGEAPYRALSRGSPEEMHPRIFRTSSAPTCRVLSPRVVLRFTSLLARILRLFPTLPLG
jgi:Transposase IS116/IS110/IS902 family